MKVLILAAGKGTRLGGAGGGLPKPLTPVGGTTPLEHALSWTAAERPECIWINVHDHSALVRERIGATVGGVPVSYSYEPQLLGTAGAWKKLEREWTEVSLIVYGDNFMRFDLRALRQTHERSGARATIALFDPERHANSGTAGGRAIMQGERVAHFVEGGSMGLVNAGAYLLEPDIGEDLPSGYLDFGHDVLPVLARAGVLAGHVVEDGAFCLGIDDPARLALARSMIGRVQETLT